jgi:hypothetical protein
LHKNSKPRRLDGTNSTGYSYLNWDQVQTVFSPIRFGNVTTNTGEQVPADRIGALANYLHYASVCFGLITERREAKRVHFIAPVLIIVCSLFNGDVQILAEEDVNGNRVHAHGHFEFVLKRGNKRICIVEAKKDDILQGKVQSLVGCESLCDVEDLSIAYGIATNYLEWCFLKNSADEVMEELLTLNLENNQPTAASLLVIANKIYSILS